MKKKLVIVIDMISTSCFIFFKEFGRDLCAAAFFSFFWLFAVNESKTQPVFYKQGLIS